MKISILTPSFNQAEYLEQNIQSVLAQGMGDLVEHIVMDGGSSDGSVAILKKYPNLIWRSERDRGQTHALNKALAVSTGDIIGWVNSDDMLPDGALSTVHEYFQINPDHYILVGNIQFVDEESKLLNTLPSEEVTYDGLLNGVQCVQQTSTFLRRTVFDKVGYFNESFHYCMDHEFFLRAAKHFKFYTIDADLGIFRRYAESKTCSSAIEFIKDRVAIKRMHGGKLFSRSSFLIAYMFFSEPFKRITILRKLVRKLKGANPDYVRYP